MSQVRAGLPLYLAAQVTTLLMTFLDFPVYMEAYHDDHSTTVTPWVGLWFVLVVFGLATGISLMILKRWRSALPDKERGQLVVGYFLGALLFILIAVYWAWERRRARAEEIFP